MKIGIMGGTFDPIHNGHILLAEHAYHEYQLDEVWFLPNGNPPHKSKESIGSETRHRKEMVKEAIAGTVYFKMEPYEADCRSVSYSYKTMEYFHIKYPGYTFYFIVGADSLFSLTAWKYPERLLKACHILAAYRGEIDTEEEMNAKIKQLNMKYHTEIKLLKMPLLEISSSEIRKKVETGIDIRGMVPDKVAAYIYKYQLFKDE